MDAASRADSPALASAAAWAPVRLAAQRGGMFMGSADGPAIEYSTAPLDNVVERLNRRLRTADVLLHNYRAGVMERLGFGYEALAEINPRLIYAGASGYGDSGPLAGLAGQDLLIQSITGIARKGTNSGATPNYLNVPLTDYASGMLLVQGVLLALIERMSSGRGQKVSISLFDTAISMQSLEAASHLNYGYEIRWFDLSLNFPVQVADQWGRAPRQRHRWW